MGQGEREGLNEFIMKEGVAGEGTWLAGAFVKLSDRLIPCTAAFIVMSACGE